MNEVTIITKPAEWRLIKSKDQQLRADYHRHKKLMRKRRKWYYKIFRYIRYLNHPMVEMLWKGKK